MKVCHPLMGFDDMIKTQAPARRAARPSRSTRSPITIVAFAVTPAAAIRTQGLVGEA